MSSDAYQEFIKAEAEKMITTPLDNISLVHKIVKRSNIDWESEIKVPKMSKKDRHYLYERIPLNERYEHPP